LPSFLLEKAFLDQNASQLENEETPTFVDSVVALLYAHPRFCKCDREFEQFTKILF